MGGAHVATSTITIDASRDRVWAVLTDPEAAREFMFDTELETDWSVGGPIRWRGSWKGTPYEDHGVVLEFEPGRRLVNTHFSPLSGEDDSPENYHTLTWTLEDADADADCRRHGADPVAGQQRLARGRRALEGHVGRSRREGEADRRALTPLSHPAHTHPPSATGGCVCAGSGGARIDSA